MPHMWTGVDGCRGGWVLVALDASRAITSVRLLKTFAEVAVESREALLTLVDIPIGLPSDQHPMLRRCDTMARELLGSRASSVFGVPAREAVWAKDYDAACAANLNVLDRRLSRQTWGICPKIREVDAVFRLSPHLQERMRETHPELCFRLLNSGRPLENTKQSAAGRRIRRELLRSSTANLDGAIRQARREYPTRSMDLDDILDAIAAAVVARLAAEGRARSVPLAREHDACGLAMEIVGV